jgi:hypothetical protein
LASFSSASHKIHVALPLDPAREERLLAGAKHATPFFMGVADVQGALEKIVRLLREEEIPYAVIGAMAVNEYGYQRVTTDVHLISGAPLNHTTQKRADPPRRH